MVDHDMPFKRIERGPRVHELIASMIEEQIIAGELKPGDTLPSESELMQQLGAGRYSVREALRVLETNGLIKVRRGSREGPVVTRPSSSLVSDFLSKAFCVGGFSRYHVHQFRRILESSIAEILSLMGLDEEWLFRIGNNIDETKKAYECGVDIVDLNAQFHILLAQATGNPVFAILLHTVFATPQITRHVALLRDDLSAATIEYHEAIFLAVKKGDGSRAKALMERHIAHIDEAWEKHEKPSADSRRTETGRP